MYIDDGLCSIHRDCIDDHLKLMNNLHTSLKFTCEKEKYGKLPFLDMAICNHGGKLSSYWYRKPTDTGLTLNFHA